MCLCVSAHLYVIDSDNAVHSQIAMEKNAKCSTFLWLLFAAEPLTALLHRASAFLLSGRYMIYMHDIYNNCTREYRPNWI